MEYNEELLRAINDAVNKADSNGEFEWVTEYLGWFPFGQYQWLEIEGNDISNKFTFSWDYKDLVAFEDIGVLIQISKEEFAEYDKEIVKFKMSKTWSVDKSSGDK